MVSNHSGVGDPSPDPHAFDVMNEVELGELFRNLAKKIEVQLPPNTGFIVLATPLSQQGIAQYASNCQREDAAMWMIETLKRWGLGDFVEREGGG